MDPILPPKTFNVYQLLKQSGMYLSPCGAGPSTIGLGMYMSAKEAEHQRTMEMLKDNGDSIFHIFELTIPNPTYKDNK